MRILIWLIVAIIIVAGMVWFLSGPSTNKEAGSTPNQETTGNINNQQITENSGIETDDEIFNEIENALEGFE